MQRQRITAARVAGTRGGGPVRAYVLRGAGEGGVEDIPAPVAGPGEAVIDVERVGLCGTDTEFFTGEMAYLHQGHASYPMRLGHDLGSFRATVAVFFSIPLSVLATFIALQIGGSSVNTMVLGGLALALSRLIDNSVVVLENIYRRIELGEPPAVAAEQGGREVALPVLAATLTTVVVFFPVTLLYGVSKFLFSSLALAVVLSLVASYVVAMTVVPLFCARFLKHAHHHDAPVRGIGARFNAAFNRMFEGCLKVYDRAVGQVLMRPVLTLVLFFAGFAATLPLFPKLGLAFFPQTDAGQFVMNLKAPSGTRLEETEKDIARLEDLIHRAIPASDLSTVVSNIGVDPGFSALYTSNAAMHTAFVQVGLKPGHHTGSFEYMARVKENMRTEMPELAAYFSSGSMVDSVLNMGSGRSHRLQVGGSNLQASYQTALELASQIRNIPGVADTFIPQDLDYPALPFGNRSHPRRRDGLKRKGSGHQRHHRSYFESDGCPQRLDRPCQRQQLLPDRSISRETNSEPGGSALHPASRLRLLASDAPGHGEQADPFRGADRSRPLPDSPHHGRLRAA